MAPKKRTNETKEDTAKEEPPAKVQKGEHDKEEKAVKDESAGVKVLEKGHIFFLYRPKVNSEMASWYTSLILNDLFVMQRLIRMK